MAYKNNRITLYLAFSLLLIFLSGCAGTIKHMRPVPPDKVVSSPEKGKALVVFMRPSGFAFAIQSSVFEVKDGKPSLVGILAAKKKVAYQVEPGKHLFMVLSESADFMSAELKPDKTYYALVTPRMGMWKARFSLKPVHRAELHTSQFDDWLEACEWVEKSADSDTWADANMADIKNKYEEYYEVWMNKPITDRPQLLPQDGK